MGSARDFSLSLAVFAAMAALALGTAAGAQADPVADFYKGKRITLIISTGVGGGYDRHARTFAKHAERHILGNPNIIPKNMPGAGHVRASNFLYNNAERDGTFLGMMHHTYVLHQVLEGQGVKYDAGAFNYLGSTAVSNATIYVWHTTGIDSFAQLKEREVLMGGTGAGSGTVLYPRVVNNVLGTKMRIIAGYKSGRRIHLAMERGEVQGRGGNNFGSLKSRNPDWLRENKINILLQIGLERNPDYPQVPLLTDLAETDEQRKIVALFSGVVAMGRPMMTTPGVPAERVAALRTAFDKTMRDPAFLADAKKQRMLINPQSGQKLQRIVADILATPPEIVAIAKTAVERGGLGKCKEVSESKLCR